MHEGSEIIQLMQVRSAGLTQRAEEKQARKEVLTVLT
jgi:hypothetical protein